MTAPTFANLTSGATGVDGTSVTTASVAPTGNRLVLLSVHVKRNTTAQPPQPTISGGGMSAWDLIEDCIVDGSGSDRANAWVFRAMEASPGSGTITIDFGAVTCHDFAWSVDQSDDQVDTTGSNGSGAIGNTTFADDDGAGTSVSASLTINSGNGGFSAAGCQGNPPSWTVRSGWNSLAEAGQASCRLLTQYEDATDTAVSATHASSRSGIVGFEVKAAAGTVEKTGSDTGSGTDATSALTSTLSGTDTGTGTDAASNVGLSGSDTATGVDAMSSTDVTGSETATGTDATNALSATLTGADTAAGTEGQSTSVDVPGADTAAGSDASSVAADVPGTDSGSGTDVTSALTSALTGSETATGTDATDSVDIEDGSIAKSGSDSAAATDATSALAADVPGQDAGSASETSAVAAGVSGSDSASAADSGALAASLTASETATGTEDGSVTVLGESPAPASRTIIVKADDRTVVVAADRRLVTVPAREVTLA